MTHEKPKVVLLERTSLDLSAAEKYGVVTYLFDGDCHRSSFFDTNDCIESVAWRLGEIGFDCHRDFVCLSGSVLGIALELVALSRYYPTVQLLMYHSVNSDYVCRKVDLRRRFDEPAVEHVEADDGGVRRS